ncbi:uncharacterized protein LDX57_006185 [Aspergillus melleus]|uniref:uncharacterized protein n=1 Tax=Aspergillus melleus TaxID=138277 RepID=UPI001E8D38D3|nr:uncharacterized protein LDX57_006185 [Aspergillus melleus]KAH8428486.1 hypothetical protein LDX57_006185 [Aspergillus melleus]
MSVAQVVPIDETTFGLLTYLFRQGGYFDEMEKVAIAALFCPRPEDLEFFINNIILPSAESAFLDFEAMWTLKNDNPKLVTHAAHAFLDVVRHGLFEQWGYASQTQSAQDMLQALCVYLQVFFDAEEYMGPEYRWELCGSMHDDLRGKLLDTAGHGLDAVVPELLGAQTQLSWQLLGLASDREGLNKMLERAATVQWMFLDAQRVWASQTEAQAYSGGSSVSQGMSVQQAQERLEGRLLEWEEYIWHCQSA